MAEARTVGDTVFNVRSVIEARHRQVRAYLREAVFFMSGEIVLRGVTRMTPHDPLRTNHRNSFYPKDCWQFSGILLAEDR